MSPFIFVVAAIGAAAGILSTLYLTISLPAVILWKLYRRAVKKIPVTR